jgi:peptidoglycan hydrolase-like protein with peptidoglycan-binding domain
MTGKVNIFCVSDIIEAKVLQTGSTGEAVVRLQHGLNAKAYRYLCSVKGSVLHVDGSFGPETYKAVKRFQRSRGLVTDGVVGPATWNSLFPTG